MQLKKVNPKSVIRSQLVNRFIELGLSASTMLKLVGGMVNMTDDQKEERASQILIMLASCRNESDVLTKLSTK